MDLIIYSRNIAGPVYVDFTVPSALSREALSKGSSIRDGVASTIAGRGKTSKYPRCSVAPFAVEDHGRLGEAAVGLIRKLAPEEQEERTQAIAHLYQQLGATLQRSSAESVLAAIK